MDGRELKVFTSLAGSDMSRIEPCYYVYGYEGTNVEEAKATKNYKTYGVLYNWNAAFYACPEGWHLPSDAEWAQLVDFIGGEEIAGGKLKEAVQHVGINLIQELSTNLALQLFLVEFTLRNLLVLVLSVCGGLLL